MTCATIFLFILTSCSTSDSGNDINTVITPILTTNTVNNISENTAISGGLITSDGGATVISRGICWSTNSNPSINDEKTIDGSGTGLFTSNMAGLNANTTYYVKAYAINSEGVAYGNENNFTTIQLTPADKILGTYSGVGKRMPNGIILGNFSGCITPPNWDSNFITGATIVNISKVNDNTININLTGGPFTSSVYSNINITENNGIINFGFGNYSVVSKSLVISANTGSWINTNSCLQGLPYYYGWSALMNGVYSYQTIGHEDFTGTKQ
tara:strand:+ start:5059 stop:5868 length:810 start_codon:yes stop_codon:yes gene_type:complete